MVRSQNSGTEPRLWVETSMTRPSSRSSRRRATIGVLGLDVDAGEGLVEQDDAGVLGQGAGEEDALALAAGQLADLALAELLHVDARQRVVDRGAVGRRGRRRKPIWP